MIQRATRTLLLCLALLPAAAGCFTSQMTTTDLVPMGAETVLTITDQGRVAFASQLGGSVARITGQLTARTDSALTLSVTSVEYLGGTSSPWSGETLVVPRAYVGLVMERRHSKSRSWTAAAVTLAALIATYVVVDIGTRGSRPDDGGGVVQP